MQRSAGFGGRRFSPQAETTPRRNVHTSLFGNRKLEARTWPQVLAQAGTVEEVLYIVRDFLANWEPEDIAGLPPESRPPARFQAPEDVALYAYALVQAHCGNAAGNPAVARMARFFSEAARQVAVVMSKVDPKPSNDS